MRPCHGSTSGLRFPTMVSDLVETHKATLSSFASTSKRALKKLWRLALTLFALVTPYLFQTYNAGHAQQTHFISSEFDLARAATTLHEKGGAPHEIGKGREGKRQAGSKTEPSTTSTLAKQVALPSNMLYP